MAKISAEEAKARLQSKPLEQQSSKKQKRLQTLMTSSIEEKEDEIELVDIINDNLFIFKKNDSYVLSPADDALSPVIGEFEKVSDDDELPPSFKDWLDTYSKEIDFFQKNEEFLTADNNETSDSADAVEMVDLGLSVKWAKCNLGASKPEEVGNYYAWGETETKVSYTTANYKFYDRSTKSFTYIGSDISKNKEYDAAFKVNQKVCMPTKVQLEELLEECTWTKKQLNNVTGWEVKGKNGNSIFIPLNGCKSESSKVTYEGNCYLWTSNNYEPNVLQAYTFRTQTKPDFFAMYRRTGAGIRPVSVKTKDDEKEKLVDLGLTVKWSSVNLGAEEPHEFGDMYAWGETETKSVFSWENYDHYISSTKKIEDIGKSISKTKYDAAYNLNQNLCVPTPEQWEELIGKCKWTPKTINNVKGEEVKGPNGNTIFIPYAGYKVESTDYKIGQRGVYMTSDTYSKNTTEYNRDVALTDEKNSVAYSRKMLGRYIRPVSSELNEDVNKKKTIKPLIPYQWSQRAPYNNLLLKDPVTNETVVTGCTNTALAMIIAYYGCIGVKGVKYKGGCTKTSAYTTSKRKMKIPSLEAIDEFDFDNLNFVKVKDFKTTKSKNAVATLMKYVGYASKANYSSEETTTNLTNCLNAAKNNLGLGSNAKMLYASSGIENFKEQIYKELSDGYPLHMSGWNKAGTSGHSFICDGYDAENDKYHCNWGWSGLYDGWFDLNLFKPSDLYDYTYNKRCIVGLHPDAIIGDTNNDLNLNITDVMNIVQSIIDNKEYERKYDVNSDGKINEQDVTDLINYILGK